MSALRLQQGIKVSAPGKVILFGEHSVVYGKRAIACSLGLRTELTLEPTEDCVSLHLPEIDVKETWSLESLNQLFGKWKRSIFQRPQEMTSDEEETLKSFLRINKKEIGKRELGLMAFFHLYMTILPYPIPFFISVKSEMPVGSGLGSSAAYAVCLSAVLLWLSDDLNPSDLSFTCPVVRNEKLSTVCDWALCCEKILHGSPSGIDNAICTYGGAVGFHAGKILQLSPPQMRILLVNTGVTRNTKVQVACVRDRYNRLESVVQPILESMDSIAKSAHSTLNEMKANCLSSDYLKRKLEHLQELVDLNHCLLGALGVSHPSLDRLVSIAKSHGLHAKLTGAGGGGFGFVLLSPDVSQEVQDNCIVDFNKEGFESWATHLGGEGLVMHHCS